MKIIQKREKCIGCGSCAVVCPDFWEMSDDGLATLKGGALNPTTENHELEIGDIGCNKEAVDICPVQIIIIE